MDSSSIRFWESHISIMFDWQVTTVNPGRNSTQQGTCVRSMHLGSLHPKISSRGHRQTSWGRSRGTCVCVTRILRCSCPSVESSWVCQGYTQVFSPETCGPYWTFHIKVWRRLCFQQLLELGWVGWGTARVQDGLRRAFWPRLLWQGVGGGGGETRTWG